jgi:DNA-binding MarR family transcriptional regulator
MDVVDLIILLRAFEREALSELQLSEQTDTTASTAERVILTAVYRQEPISVGELTTVTGFVQSYVSNVVSRLDAKGILTHSPDPSDRRRTLISFRPGLREEIARALTLDARPILERLLEPDGEYTIDHVMQVLQYLSQQASKHLARQNAELHDSE